MIIKETSSEDKNNLLRWALSEREERTLLGKNTGLITADMIFMCIYIYIYIYIEFYKHVLEIYKQCIKNK